MNSNNNITQAQLEEIESYLNDTLLPEKRDLFENKMNSDPEFKLLVEEVKEMLLGIESGSLHNKLDDFHDEMVPVRSIEPSNQQALPPLKRLHKVIRYVAVAVVVIGFGAVLLLNSDSPSEKLFAKHFNPDPGLPTTMGVSNDFEFYDAMVNYKQGDYKTAIQKWEALRVSNIKNDTLHYFLGVAQLADGNENKAIEHLKDLLDNNTNSFKQETAYYLGLAYLKAGNVEDAKKYLIFSKTESGNQILSELND